jgi:hypothetical protein
MAISTEDIIVIPLSLPISTKEYVRHGVATRSTSTAYYSIIHNDYHQYESTIQVQVLGGYDTIIFCSADINSIIYY